MYTHNDFANRNYIQHLIILQRHIIDIYMNLNEIHLVPQYFCHF